MTSIKKLFSKNLFLITAILFCFIPAKNVYAEVGGFLNIINGAPSSAMGEAFTSKAECIYGLEFNPAGFVFSDSQQLTFSHLEYYSDIQNEFFAYSRKLKKAAVGFSLKMQGIDDIERDAMGFQTADFTNRSYQLKTSAAFLAAEKISVGAALSYIRETIYGRNGNAVALDLGFLVNNIFITKKNFFNAGLSLQNFGTKIKFGNSKYSLPEKIRIGASLNHLGLFNNFFKNSSFAIDYVINDIIDNTINIGTEFISRRNFTLRIGYISSQDKDTKSIFSIGGGLGFKYGLIDYAYKTHSELDSTHTFTFSINF